MNTIDIHIILNTLIFCLDRPRQSCTPFPSSSSFSLTAVRFSFLESLWLEVGLLLQGSSSRAETALSLTTFQPLAEEWGGASWWVLNEKRCSLRGVKCSVLWVSMLISREGKTEMGRQDQLSVLRMAGVTMMFGVSEWYFCWLSFEFSLSNFQRSCSSHWHFCSSSRRLFFYFWQREMICVIADSASAFVCVQMSVILLVSSCLVYLIMSSMFLRFFLSESTDLRSTWLIAREHLTSDSFKFSKFLEMLWEMWLFWLGWLSPLICCMRNCWNSERWLRVEERLSVRARFSNSFSSMVEQSFSRMRLSSSFIYYQIISLGQSLCVVWFGGVVVGSGCVRIIIMNGDDFFQVSCQVPFRPIARIELQSVVLAETVIRIRARMTLAGEAEGEWAELERTEGDVEWLVENLQSCGHCPLVPKRDCSDPFASVLQLLGSVQPGRVKKLGLLKERVLQRCLGLLVGVVLPHLKAIDEVFTTPLFIFFHSNFALYRNPIYYPEKGASLSSKMGNFFWQKYALFTGKGNSWQQLEGARNGLNEQRERLRVVSERLQEYVSQLSRLQEEFIAQKEKIRRRLAATQELQLNFAMQLRYLELVVEEAKETAARAEQQAYECEGLVLGYTKRVQLEAQEAGKSGKKLLGDYVRVVCQQQQQLKIGPL